MIAATGRARRTAYFLSRALDAARGKSYQPPDTDVFKFANAKEGRLDAEELGGQFTKEARHEAAMDVMAPGMQGFVLISFHETDQITEIGKADFEARTVACLADPHWEAVDALIADAKRSIGVT